ncbi:hypothetical protein MNBD_ALPHA08-2382 [hydrothermal vent metagenome]|uniref:HTH lysR-type domain-containing protein n=1 Tax=hydrothermal vent metagenome TaxID=652676 RepID=A0A3B0SHM3_9ZZZZ
MLIDQRRKISLWMQTAMSVASSKSPTISARQLGISVTTVYRHVDLLEQSLQYKIFIRRPNGWILREQAGILIKTGHKIEQLLARAEGEIRKAAGVEEGNLRIAVSDDFAAFYVTPHLQKFCATYPEIKPELVISSDFADLVHGQADVAIRPDMDPGDSLVGQRVARLTHAFYASADFLQQNGKPTNLRDLKNFKICDFGHHLSRYTAAIWLKKHVPSHATIARFGNTSTMVLAVEASLGIGLLPCYIGDKLSSLSPVLKIPGTLPVDIWLVSAATNRKRPKIQAFFNFFAPLIRADKGKFLGKPYAKSPK